MKNLKLLAFDLGASNGRSILGSYNGETVELSETYRFENNLVDLQGTAYWDVLSLYRALLSGFAETGKITGGQIDSFGIDTWGVDYGLLDRHGKLLGNPVCYRNSLDEDMDKAWEVIPKRELFDHTGIGSLNFNTIYQLYRRVRERDVQLANADALLMMPDLLGYFLTGDKIMEYTNATTGMFINYKTKKMDNELLRRLGIPTYIFHEMDIAGNLRGSLYKNLADDLGLNQVPYAAVGTHDTASAVAAIPGQGDFAFCSSGTWSLFGVETPEAIVTDNVFENDFSNEGTVQGGCRPLKNIMGLWLIQECRRSWQKEGKNYSWDDIVKMAEQEPKLRTVIDPDYTEFFHAGDMPGKIRRYCEKVGEPVPENDGQIARTIYESLALKYRWAVERLEEIKGHKIDQLNIVGGGIQNKFLNRCAADAIERPVITGPTEGAAIGNLLMQAVALGELGGIEDVREVVRRSVSPDIYEPQPSEAWRDAYARLLKQLE